MPKSDTEDTKDEFTCFVRNLAPAVDSERLTGVFAEVGPVRKAFIVKGRGEQVHKGLAFVTFALSADAQKAARELNAVALEGQPLQVLSLIHI